MNFRPKFSVLLPTKNRLDLLKEAIETVVRQDYENWEMIVSDNASNEDVVGYVRSLNDPRIKVIRSEVAISVTDNWNLAIEASTGDYVIMLGDDDGLMPRYFRKMLSALKQLECPDLIYYGAYHFAYPGVIPWELKGYLADITEYYPILRGEPRTSLIPFDTVQSAAAQSMRFRAEFGYNMQLFLFSRQLVEKLQTYGKTFQGPFPDYYAANVAFLISDRVGRIAEPLVIIGISKKSYGNYFFNDREEDGVSFLGIEKYLSDISPDIKSSILPGSNINTSWLISLAPIAKLINRPDLKIDLQRYRILQVAVAARSNNEALKSKIWHYLSLREKVFFWGLTNAKRLPTGLSQTVNRIADEYLAQYAKPVAPPKLFVVGKYRNRQEVFEEFSSA